MTSPWEQAWPHGHQRSHSEVRVGSRTSLAEAPRDARRGDHVRSGGRIRRSARSVRCRLRGPVASGRTTRRPEGRAFRDLNGPFRAAHKGPAGSDATGDAGLSPGTCGARVGQPDGASNDARRAGGTSVGAARRTGALHELLNGSTKRARPSSEKGPLTLSKRSASKGRYPSARLHASLGISGPTSRDLCRTA